MSETIMINARVTTDENTGFGINSAMYGGRLVNKDGRANIHRSGIRFFESLSWYHSLIEMKSWKFLTFIFLFFLGFNMLFAGIYLLIGIQHLSGMVAVTHAEKVLEAFFFSAQTFTTVGYGRISPTGYLTSFIASFEAFSGLLFFAIATGLFYARFSRPQSFLRFSQNILIAPYKQGIAVMFRMAPYKNNRLTDAEVTVNLAMVVNENGRMMNRFFPLHLELQKINALSLSWTLVHAINENSPFYNWQDEEFKNAKFELLIYVKAFDDTFSNTVVARTSYTSDELVVGAKFVHMYRPSHNGTSTILEMDKLNLYERL